MTVRFRGVLATLILVCASFGAAAGADTAEKGEFFEAEEV